MRFAGSLIVVKDMERSKRFYEDVLKAKQIMDFGANVTYAGGFSLQTEETWTGFIEKSPQDIVYKNHGAELYFEEIAFDKFLNHLETFKDIEYCNKVREYDWGQRVVRFYDPDGHLIEVGESLREVCKRFLKQGMNIEDIVKRTMLPEKFVRSCRR